MAAALGTLAPPPPALPPRSPDPVLQVPTLLWPLLGSYNIPLIAVVPPPSVGI